MRVETAHWCPSLCKVVLEFFKSRSPESKRILPKLEEESTKRPNVIFLKVNVDMLTVRSLLLELDQVVCARRS